MLTLCFPGVPILPALVFFQMLEGQCYEKAEGLLGIVDMLCYCTKQIMQLSVGGFW